MKSIIFLPLCVIALALSACSKPPSSIKDGAYQATEINGVDEKMTAVVKNVPMIFERGNLRVSFEVPGGKVPISMSQRKEDTWPEGCGHALEIMGFGTSLQLDTLSIQTPILVKACPVESDVIVLREDGDISNVLNPCEGATGVCIKWDLK